MNLPDSDTRATRQVDEEARWRAYQAWLRQHGNGLAEPSTPADHHPTGEPSLAAPTSASTQATARAKRGAVLIPVIALGAVLVGGLGLLTMNRSASRNDAAPSAAAPPAAGELKVQADASAASSKLRTPRLLPCFVAGRPAGDMPLDACARRNGVASGKLDVGIDRPPASAVAFGPALPVPARVLVDTPRRGPPRVEMVDSPAPAPPPPPRPVAVADVRDSVRTVRRFYRALAEDDPYSAAALLTPEQRGDGAFAAARLGQSDGAQPLRVTEVDPLGPSSVLVRYEVPDAAGDICVGSAHVETVVRGDETLVRSVQTAGGC